MGKGMNRTITALVFILPLVAILALSPILADLIFAQTQYMPVRHQWMMNNDPNQITCPTGMGMMMGYSGNPACLTPSTYMRLADRGWGNYDFNYMTRDQQFMTGTMNNMMQHPQMMGMMMNNPQMMQAMHGNTQWMNMMHGQGGMMGQGMMGRGMMMGNYTMGCPMCASMMGTNMNQPMMMNNAWMMHNPQMMHGMMGTMMNDPQFQQQMMNHMMGNQQYMQQLMQNQTFAKQFNP